ncbi:hypothetical protein [Pseudomonas amygdali]|uniref:hypothetical protein n=1 Tax=Pseudomonas amygdali TaxID=47877 RepID=UPI0034538BF4
MQDDLIANEMLTGISNALVGDVGVKVGQVKVGHEAISYPSLFLEPEQGVKEVQA